MVGFWKTHTFTHSYIHPLIHSLTRSFISASTKRESAFSPSPRSLFTRTLATGSASQTLFSTSVAHARPLCQCHAQLCYTATFLLLRLCFESRVPLQASQSDRLHGSPGSQRGKKFKPQGHSLTLKETDGLSAGLSSGNSRAAAAATGKLCVLLFISNDQLSSSVPNSRAISVRPKQKPGCVLELELPMASTASLTKGGAAYGEHTETCRQTLDVHVCIHVLHARLPGWLIVFAFAFC